MPVWLWILYAIAATGMTGVAGLIGARFKKSLTLAPLPSNPPAVSIIVPARDEERNMRRCAHGLTQQRYINLEIIFVDDDSTDATPDILARVNQTNERVRVVNTQPRPADWNGKQWACHTGAQAATGDWLCFMDADTYGEPDLIERTMAFALEKHVGLLSLQPWYEMVGLWERIVLPAALTHLFLLFPPNWVNDPKRKLVVANGQFILLSRTVYDEIDGHRDIRSRMMDDYSLAENVQAAGYRVFIADGAEVMRVRMYRNLREMWLGARKAAIQLTGGWLISIAGLIGHMLVNILPWCLLVWALVTGHRVATVTMGMVVGVELLFTALVRIIGFRAPPWSAVTYPLGGLLIAAVGLESMISAAFGREIQWKDRPVLGVPEPTLTRPNLSRLRGKREIGDSR
jgi:chlorobactene glucosyltransferase